MLSVYLGFAFFCGQFLPSHLVFRDSTLLVSAPPRITDVIISTVVKITHVFFPFIVRAQAEVNTSSEIYFNNTDEQVIIRCSGRGYPSPVVSWFRDRKKINTNSSSDVYQVFGKTTPTRFLGWISTILYINPDPAHSQFGNYTCNATKLKANEHDLQVVEIVRKYPTLKL